MPAHQEYNRNFVSLLIRVENIIFYYEELKILISGLITTYLLSISERTYIYVFVPILLILLVYKLFKLTRHMWSFYKSHLTKKLLKDQDVIINRIVITKSINILQEIEQSLSSLEDIENQIKLKIKKTSSDEELESIEWILDYIACMKKVIGIRSDNVKKIDFFNKK